MVVAADMAAVDSRTGTTTLEVADMALQTTTPMGKTKGLASTGSPVKSQISFTLYH